LSIFDEILRFDIVFIHLLWIFKLTRLEMIFFCVRRKRTSKVTLRAWSPQVHTKKERNNKKQRAMRERKKQEAICQTATVCSSKVTLCCDGRYVTVHIRI
jgi:hypothetical protein